MPISDYVINAIDQLNDNLIRFENVSSEITSESKFEEISNLLKSSSKNHNVSAWSNFLKTMNRPEVVSRLISTLLGLSVSFAISYFGVRWLVKAMDPTGEEKKNAQKKLSEHELCIAANLVDPSSMTTSWEDIGGLEDVKEEIQESIILPFRRPDLFAQSNLLQAPKGVLLHGPPGCGKTMIAKAIAGAAGARFINLQLSTLVDKWYGESQKRAEAVFSLAIKIQPSIVFIDEIDSFLRSRNSTDHESTAMMKTQFMSFWDGLMTDSGCRVMVVGATNRPSDVDAAILRRMPSMFYIGLPDAKQREDILNVILQNEDVNEDLELSEIARTTQGFSGSDLRELCRNAAIIRVRELLHDTEGTPLRSISYDDFKKAMQKMRVTNYISQKGQHVPLDLD